ncbi:hypothetical protein L198_07083 [Cryptococcus wingfieldii CBS 7118]|uniref:Uncharacterized protein n=1 Tax=Cryptococcus wingfieldii CBS 7118 TaxID=1295528 RepID=A0A1E3IH62_9TREE|nr:hypothetical protein L198_07083 [Cryptococcus wingfieldii CBS 7118]ODN87081.1 hypothetical protein L198_07083 [Cryptococcus wingfieldii CBS 7118]
MHSIQLHSSSCSHPFHSPHHVHARSTTSDVRLFPTTAQRRWDHHPPFPRLSLSISFSNHDHHLALSLARSWIFPEKCRNLPHPLTILSWVAPDSHHEPGDLFYFSGDIAHDGNASFALPMHSASEAHINTSSPTVPKYQRLLQESSGIFKQKKTEKILEKGEAQRCSASGGEVEVDVPKLNREAEVPEWERGIDSEGEGSVAKRMSFVKSVEGLCNRVGTGSVPRFGINPSGINSAPVLAIADTHDATCVIAACSVPCCLPLSGLRPKVPCVFKTASLRVGLGATPKQSGLKLENALN